MTCKINADTTNGLKLESDTSGALDIQSAGVTKVSFDASGNMTTSGTIPSSALSGNLPALNGSALTNLTSGNLTGALPAIDGSALTGISAGDIVASSVSASNNSNGYVKFSNNLVIQWLRKSITGTQTITYPLAMNHYYGAYVAGVSTGNGHVRVHSISTSSITVSNAEQNIVGWVLVTGRKT
jgi:hypothetical protein